MGRLPMKMPPPPEEFGALQPSPQRLVLTASTNYFSTLTPLGSFRASTIDVDARSLLTRRSAPMMTMNGTLLARRDIEALL